MSNKYYFLVFLLFAVLIAANLTPVGFFLGKPIVHVYQYESSDAGFQEIEVPEKGRNFALMMRKFEEYKSTQKSDREIVLYRNVARNPILFYEWYDFVTHKRWQLEFRASSNDT